MTKENYCTFYLVRHAESDFNAKGLLVGDTDATLTENGRKQAEKLAIKLKGVSIDAIYSSNLLRAKQTAEILSKERKLALQTSELIRERSYGSHEGLSSHEYEEKVRQAKKQISELVRTMGKTYHDLLGVENNKNLLARMTTFLREIAVANPSKSVLVVTHGGILRAFLAHLYPEKFIDLHAVAIGNTAYVKISSDGTDFIFSEAHGIDFDRK